MEYTHGCLSMVLNLNLFENINLNFKCFPWGKKYKKRNYDIDRNLYDVSKEYRISILPINHAYDIENLYPITDHVELWNIFIVGNDKTYILANINDDHINIPNHEHLSNRKGQNILPDELFKIFDRVWSTTLSGQQMQFYMVWNGKLYFINTYPFFNGKQSVIGAILFMRAFEQMPDMLCRPNRGSIDNTSAKIAKLIMGGGDTSANSNKLTASTSIASPSGKNVPPAR